MKVKNAIFYPKIVFAGIIVVLVVVVTFVIPKFESFYDKFKIDLGDPNRFDTLGELVAEICRTMYRYNTVRIHTALKMPPRQFARLHETARIQTIVLE